MYVAKDSRDMTSFYPFIYDFQFKKLFVVNQNFEYTLTNCLRKQINYLS